MLLYSNLCAGFSSGGTDATGVLCAQPLPEGPSPDGLGYTQVTQLCKHSCVGHLTNYSA